MRSQPSFWIYSVEGALSAVFVQSEGVFRILILGKEVRVLRKLWRRIPWIRVCLLSQARRRKNCPLRRQALNNIRNLPRSRDDIRVAYVKPEYVARLQETARREMNGG